MLLTLRGWAAERPAAAAAVLIGALTAIRVLVLFLTPLELYPDEAQYWLWSRHLAFGYYSKPPMIAWLIWATTAVGGDAEPWVRLSAPIVHGAAALALAGAARRLYDARTGFWAALVYALMPGVQLSCGVVATDAPLLLCLSLSLWAYATLWTARSPREARIAALAFGVALGLATLSKYAGLYYAGGAALHAAFSRRARAMWTPARLGLAAGALLVVISPNLGWNVAHKFQTLAHTADNANLAEAGEVKRRGGFDPRGGLGFLLGQFGVFGPVPLAVVAGVAVWGAARRRLAPEDGLLLAFVAPPLAIVFGEAVLVRANANWAAAAYAAGAVLAAAWLRRARLRPARGPGLWLQAGLAAGFMAAALSPGLADHVGLGNGFKRARGWRDSTAAVRSFAQGLQAEAPVSVVAVDDRFLFNALSYYGRDWLGSPGAPPLRMWVHESRAHNQAESTAPLVVADGGRVAFASLPYPRQAKWDFARIGATDLARIPLGGGRSRDIVLFEGLGFWPRPRDPATGRPIPPPGEPPLSQRRR